jgi:hypothetical protein
LLSADDHGPSLERVDRAGRQPFVIVPRDQETVGRRDIRLGHADAENLFCKRLLHRN